jgi:hypothetical protein
MIAKVVKIVAFYYGIGIVRAWKKISHVKGFRFTKDISPMSDL